MKWIQEEIRIKIESVHNLNFNSMFNFPNKTRRDMIQLGSVLHCYNKLAELRLLCTEVLIY